MTYLLHRILVEKEEVRMSCAYPEEYRSNNFAIILVLFIILVIAAKANDCI